MSDLMRPDGAGLKGAERNLSELLTMDFGD